MCLLAFADCEMGLKFVFAFADTGATRRPLRAYFVSRQMVKPFREPFHGQSRQLVEIDIPALTLFSMQLLKWTYRQKGCLQHDLWNPRDLVWESNGSLATSGKPGRRRVENYATKVT